MNNDVVVKVMEKYEQIINDKLYKEENKENKTFINDIKSMVKFGITDETKDMLR